MIKLCLGFVNLHIIDTHIGGSLKTTVLQNTLGGANCLCDKTCRFHGSEDSYYGLLVYEAVWVPSLGAPCLLLPV